MSKFHNKSAPLILLDRDGTINLDPGYLSSAKDVALIDGAASALAELKKAGFELLIVSNQSGIGRGMFEVSQLEKVNQKLKELLISKNKDAKIDAIFYCPHKPEDSCICRKPKAGLLREFFIHSNDLSNVWIVGDKLSDVLLGEELSLPVTNRYLVLTGEGEGEYKKYLSSEKQDFLLKDNVLKSLRDVSKDILSKQKEGTLYA